MANATATIGGIGALLALAVCSCGTALTPEQVEADAYALTGVPRVEMVGSLELARQSTPTGEMRAVTYYSTASESQLLQAFDADFARKGYRRIRGKTPDGAHRYQSKNTRRALLIEPHSGNRRKVTVFMLFPHS